MKIVKISPKHQITIPSIFRSYCETGYFSIYEEKNTLVLHSIEVKNARDFDDILEEIVQKFKK